MTSAQVAVERFANRFVGYLYEEYKGTLHVRRVASWLGFVLLGVAQVAPVERWRVPRTRQLHFSRGNRRYKLKYNHQAGARGGIELIEVLPGRGSPEGQVVVTITNLSEAEAFYRDPSAAFPKLSRSGASVPQ